MLRVKKNQHHADWHYVLIQILWSYTEIGFAFKVKQKRIKLKLRVNSIWRKIMRQFNKFCNAHKLVINVENNSEKL